MTVLDTIPLWAGRLESDALVQPRVEPRPEYYSFFDEDRKFNAEIFLSAIKLNTLVDMLGAKVTTLIYVTLTDCLTDNLIAQEVVRSYPEAIHTLYVQLH